jgi:MoaA/NifB/PqqE/SkfB family radical SAM enzyme
MITKKANLLKVLKNVYLSKKEPISLVHFITNRCNARCSFCFIDFDDPNTFKGELNIKEIDKLTKTLGNSLLNVNFTGGEPFARHDITEIAKLYIKNSTIQSIYITTNASLPDRIENFVKEITSLEKNIEIGIQISIDDFPDQHNKVRKIKNLFDSCIDTYFRLKKYGEYVNPSVSITVTHENCENIKNIFEHLFVKCKIDSIKCTIVRDEGVYKTPEVKRKKIFQAYSWLTSKISELSDQDLLKNYNKKSLQGRLHNEKDKISWDLVKQMYLEPKYISPCHAGSLFGIISASGLIYPCEILEDKVLGNLRKNEMNFMKIWNNDESSDVKKFIKKTNCNCTYECALSYNILGNYRYQHKLIKAALKI